MSPSKNQTLWQWERPDIRKIEEIVVAAEGHYFLAKFITIAIVNHGGGQAAALACQPTGGEESPNTAGLGAG